jgi:hypothetical protein
MLHNVSPPDQLLVCILNGLARTGGDPETYDQIEKVLRGERTSPAPVVPAPVSVVPVYVPGISQNEEDDPEYDNRSFGHTSRKSNRRLSLKKKRLSKHLPRNLKPRNIMKNTMRKKLSKKLSKRLSNSHKRLSNLRKKLSIRSRLSHNKIIEKFRRSNRNKKTKRNFGSTMYGLQSGPPYTGVYPMQMGGLTGTSPNLYNVVRPYTVSGNMGKSGTSFGRRRSFGRCGGVFRC